MSVWNSHTRAMQLVGYQSLAEAKKLPAKPIAKGTVVHISGLETRGDLNGRHGLVSEELENGRFVVKINGESLAVRPANLKTAPDELKNGTRVRIHDLVKHKEHNNKFGVVTSFDAKSSRNRVHLDGVRHPLYVMRRNLSLVKDETLVLMPTGGNEGTTNANSALGSTYRTKGQLNANSAGGSGGGGGTQSPAQSSKAEKEEMVDINENYFDDQIRPFEECDPATPHFILEKELKDMTPYELFEVWHEFIYAPDSIDSKYSMKKEEIDYLVKNTTTTTQDATNKVTRRLEKITTFLRKLPEPGKLRDFFMSGLEDEAKEPRPFDDSAYEGIPHSLGLGAPLLANATPGILDVTPPASPGNSTHMAYHGGAAEVMDSLGDNHGYLGLGLGLAAGVRLREGAQAALA